MKKIVSKEKEEKKKRRNQIILGVFLVFVMMGSVFGVIVGSFGNNPFQRGVVSVNGFNFMDYEGRWIYQASENSFFSFRNLPNETDFLFDEEIKLKSLEEYSGEVFYFYSEDGISRIQLIENFRNNVLRMQEACLKESSNETIEYCLEKNFPFKNCENNFIIIREYNESRIFRTGNCVFIEGDKKDLNKLTDEFIYRTIGIK